LIQGKHRSAIVEHAELLSIKMDKEQIRLHLAFFIHGTFSVDSRAVG